VKLRDAANLFVVRTAKCNLCKMQDLEEMAIKLLEAARKLPQGARRHEMLKEIGRIRARISALLQSEPLLGESRLDPEPIPYNPPASSQGWALASSEQSAGRPPARTHTR
jgi:hypothetical protein